HAAEDEVRDGDAGVVGIAAEILEVELLGAVLADGVDRVKEDRPAELLALCVDVPELAFVELLAVDIGREVHALDARQLRSTLELTHGEIWRLHRHHGEAEKPLWML